MSMKTLVRDVIELGVRRPQSEGRLEADAQAYWTATGSTGWLDNSHCLGGTLSETQWRDVGDDHLALYRKMAASAGMPERCAHVLGWGCGGGANARTFAPHAERFTGVDLSREHLVECERQVRAVCDTPFQPVLIDVAHPERALSGISGSVDLFLCLYVLELVPSPEYGLRLMRLAHRMLVPGGAAFVQIKVTTGWRTRPRRRGYRESTAAAMTTYRVEDFRAAVEAIGFVAGAPERVPHTGLDGPYAYFLLRKPQETP